MKIDGRKIAQKIFNKLLPRVKSLKRKGVTPRLVIVLIGDDPASSVYVRQKKLRAGEIDVQVTIFRLPSTINELELISYLNDLNHFSTVHGIIVQRPLPGHIDSQLIASKIDPKKDVDGLHPESKFPMPLAAAVLKILEQMYEATPRRSRAYDLRGWLKTKSIVVIGRGETGGKPIIAMLRSKLGVEPLIIDSKTMNPLLITKSADIIISAVGKPAVIKPTMIKKGVVLIGVGLHRGADGKLHGDYEEDKIKNIASFYTPTPYGVGPVNVAMLLKNVVRAAETSPD